MKHDYVTCDDYERLEWLLDDGKVIFGFRREWDSVTKEVNRIPVILSHHPHYRKAYCLRELDGDGIRIFGDLGYLRSCGVDFVDPWVAREPIQIAPGKSIFQSPEHTKKEES